MKTKRKSMVAIAVAVIAFAFIAGLAYGPLGSATVTIFLNAEPLLTCLGCLLIAVSALLFIGLLILWFGYNLFRLARLLVRSLQF